MVDAKAVIDADATIKKATVDIVTDAWLIEAVLRIVGFYVGVIWLLHRFGTQMPAHNDFLTSGIIWDHPEPNFTVSPAITEFWSVLTAIPLAGGVLCCLGIHRRLGAPVMCVYVGTFLMYNFALVSHMTLSKPAFQITLTSVMTNCLSAFMIYGFFACDLSYVVPVFERLDCQKCRAKVVGFAFILVAVSAVKLPDALGPGGGVWTLFLVQAPPVWIATSAAVALHFYSPREDLKPGYRMVSWAGGFLSLAMVLSYWECKVGTSAVLLDTLGGFPVLHVAVHVSEQIGIYMYGLSLAFLHHVHISPRSGAEFRWLLGGSVPVFSCDVDELGWARDADPLKAELAASTRRPLPPPSTPPLRVQEVAKTPTK